MKIAVKDAYQNPEVWNKVNTKKAELYYRIGHRPQLVTGIHLMNDTYYLALDNPRYKDWRRVRSTFRLILQEIPDVKPRKRIEFEYVGQRIIRKLVDWF